MAELHKAIAQLMEGRKGRPPEGNDLPIFRQLVEQLRDRAPPGEQLLLEAFARQLFSQERLLLLESLDPARLVGLTVGAFSFLRDRQRQPMAVRVYTPSHERHGWGSPHTVVETVLDDRPFIVDTICETVQRMGGEIRVLLHPVLGVRRDEQGNLQDIGPPREGTARESFLHAQVANLAPTADLERMLSERLRHVMLANDDYRALRARVAAWAEELRLHPPPSPWGDDAEEICIFFDWLGDENFVYLGHREYEFDRADGQLSAVIRRGSGLGILRDDEGSRYRARQQLSDELRRRTDEPPILLVSKTESLSPIHRFVPMDDISLKRVDAAGTVTGQRRLLGLFTTKAAREAASETPILRRRLEAILAQEGTVEHSHDYKELAALFDTIPKEELFASRRADLPRLLRAIMAAEVHPDVNVFCRPDALRRGMFVVVILPRARFSTELRDRVTALLCQRLSASVLHEHIALEERPSVRLHYYLSVPGAILEHPPVEVLEHGLRGLLSTWEDELRDQLATAYGQATADHLAAKYCRAFPADYKAGIDVAEAVRDIGCLESLAATGQAQIEFAEAARDGEPAVLKLYVADEPVVLSDFIPVLENLGLRVLGEDMVDLKETEASAIRMHSFFVQPAVTGKGDLASAGPLLVRALHALRAGEVENDRLNSLILGASLEWGAVEVLRTYAAHARQIGLASQATLADALTGHPECARRLFDFFAAKFDPGAFSGPPVKRLLGPVAEAEKQFIAALDAVDSLSHDRVLRALGIAVAATVRTNFFTPPVDGEEKNPIAIKLECAELPHLPRPRPRIETFVHAPYFEGIHLRAGPIARGGIRLSDRPDDYRAEIMGLMRTQVVKNAVIVPVGAKGGFVVKGRAPRTPVTIDQAERAYRGFIGALLSITDNVDRRGVVPPRGQLIYDEADPYLVVAADKGTATFSDVANDVAARHRFWLGDAFASGGKHGYDHKQLGITARGAWECARQHFREMDRDLDREPVSVIGIGDMSGDVFGNGMLCSRALRLRAAFNHREIFLDPDPDSEQAYRERERLFRLASSGWSDYGASCLSVGGGVYPRSAKAVPLSPEARAMLGIDVEAPSGEEVIRAILRMEADLLWNGGIGTYVKASDETHNEVGDQANDSVRVNADELRVLVVAEGGNLGFTQRARVAFALAGGHINTDAIDNCGGVSLSDREVNIKIALAPLVAAGELSGERRNELLAELAEESCQAVLAHIRRQAFALSLDRLRSRTRLRGFRDLMATLEAEGALDRQLENLPTREALRTRRQVFLGFARPELAVLLAAAKLDLQRRILESPLCTEPAVERYLREYFPAALGQRFGYAVDQHPLRQEIAAVRLANRLIDLMGMTFLVRAAGDTGRNIVDIVKAWTAALAISGGEETLAQIASQQSRLSASGDEQCCLVVAEALERATMWIVETQPPSASLSNLIESFQRPASELLASWPDLLTEARRDAYQADVARFTELGLTAASAEQLTRMAAVEDALEVSHIARELDIASPTVADAYFRAATLVDLDWVRHALPTTLRGEDRWEQRAIAGLLEGLLYGRRQLTVNVLGYRRGEAVVEDCLQLYAEACGAQLDRLRGLIDDLKAATRPTLPGLLVVMRELGRLVRSA